MDNSNSKKILKLAVSIPGVLDKILDSRITKRHFLGPKKDQESVILSKIYEIAVEYHNNSGGSLLTSEVFNARIGATKLSPDKKSEVISIWMDILKEKTQEDDLYHFIEEMKHNEASKLLDQAIDGLHEDLKTKGIKEAVVSLLGALDGVYGQFTAIDTEKTNFDINSRAHQFEEEYLHRAENKKKFSGIKMGIPEIDDATMGFGPGQIVTFLAPTAGGKSIQLLNCGIYANQVMKKNILYFSFEMDAWLCELRHISNLLDISYKRLKSLSFQGEELKYLIEQYRASTSEAYFEYDVNIEDPTPEYIDSRIREITSTKGKPDAVIIDYIGNMTTRKSYRGQKKWEREGDAIEELFRMAKRYQIPFITAQQMNRDVFRENRKRKEEGKAAMYYQDAASGDQRLMHCSYYVIGLEPDKDNGLMTYHAVKMRDAPFEPCIAKVDVDHNKIYSLSEFDQRSLKIAKGIIKPTEDDIVGNKPAKKKFKSDEEVEDDNYDDIPWGNMLIN